jgi:hypothetical protein
MEAISPIVRGLLNGYQIGSMLQRQQAEMRQQQRLEQAEKFDQEMRSASLLSQLTGAGARPITESDQYEMDGGAAVRFGGVNGVELNPAEAMTVTPSTKFSRVLTVPGTGQRLLLPSIDERDEREARVSARSLLDRNRAQAEALREAERIKEESRARQLETEGLPLPSDLATIFGAPAGKKVMPGYMDELMRAATYRESLNARPAPGAPIPSKVSYVVDQATGNVTPIIPFVDEKGMPQIRSGAPAQGIARPRPREGSRSAAASNKPRKLTPAQKADVLTEVVLKGTQSPNIEDAIANVEKFYQDDPRFTPAMRVMVKQRLRRMKDGNPEYKEPAAAAAPVTQAAPAVGTVEGGYRFKGGNPADPSAWEKVN